MVYFYVPNLIGYARVVLAALAFYFHKNPVLFFALYASSELLDAVDGYAARLFNQSTKFGAVLDMVTDRCCTAALMIMLANMYPQYQFPLMAMVAIDLTSHYAHLYITLLRGDSSHKDVDASTNFFLRLYYGNRYVLFTLCAANEGLFLLPYLHYFGPIHLPGGASISTEAIFGLWLVVVAPLGFAKQFMNIVQMVNAFKDLAEWDMLHTTATTTRPQRSPRKRAHSGNDHSVEGDHGVADATLTEEGIAADKRRQAEVLGIHEVAETKGFLSPAQRTRHGLKTLTPGRGRKKL